MDETKTHSELDGMGEETQLKEEALGQVVGGVKAVAKATSDYFLKIEGVDGESQDDKHKSE